MTKLVLPRQPLDPAPCPDGTKVIIGNWKILHQGLWHRLPRRRRPAGYVPPMQIEMFDLLVLGSRKGGQ